ncbi:MAG: hypothetical protein IJ407_01770 [Clostridia bacterium]|nr:hypothetical protein [Clostridia bacterium]
MTSSVDQLLLSPSQLAGVEQMKKAYREYQEKGDAAGMQWAHDQAEKIRADAGYSGGEDGNEYILLSTAGETPAGYNGYEALINRYAEQGINRITAGYESTLAGLDAERADLLAEGEQNQTSARSAAWNRRRLSDSGMLTRGIENTGLADVVTATALNQAAANAYLTLLDTENDLQENDAARITARADALTEAAELHKELGSLLGEGYQSFYEQEADRQQEFLLQQTEQQAKKEQDQQNYYYQLALQQLKRQWELEDQKLS